MFHNSENETLNDDQFLIVFKKENTVVLVKRYSLNELPVVFKLDNNRFTSNNEKFSLVISKQYNEDKIKELVLKNTNSMFAVSNSEILYQNVILQMKKLNME